MISCEDIGIKYDVWYRFDTQEDKLLFLTILVTVGIIKATDIDYYAAKTLLCVTEDNAIRYRTDMPKAMYIPNNLTTYKYEGTVHNLTIETETTITNKGETNMKNIEAVINYINDIYQAKLTKILKEQDNARIKFIMNSKNGSILAKAVNTITNNLKLTDLPFEHPYAPYGTWLLTDEEKEKLNALDNTYDSTAKALIARKEEAIVLCKVADTYEQINKILSDYDVIIG